VAGHYPESGDWVRQTLRKFFQLADFHFLCFHAGMQQQGSCDRVVFTSARVVACIMHRLECLINLGVSLIGNKGAREGFLRVKLSWDSSAGSVTWMKEWEVRFQGTTVIAVDNVSGPWIWAVLCDMGEMLNGRATVLTSTEGGPVPWRWLYKALSFMQSPPMSVSDAGHWNLYRQLTVFIVCVRSVRSWGSRWFILRRFRWPSPLDTFFF
jgi:hypothetical protein